MTGETPNRPHFKKESVFDKRDDRPPSAEPRSIDQYQSQLWLIKAELRSISALFQCISPDAALDGDDLFGVGERLRRISKRIGKISDLVGGTIRKC